MRNAPARWEASYAAKKALQWLELHDERNAGLDAMRLEMIDHILTIRQTLNGDGP